MAMTSVSLIAAGIISNSSGSLISISGDGIDCIPVGITSGIGSRAK